MQLITAIPLFAINAPANVIVINEMVVGIANFELVEPQVLYDSIIVPIFRTTNSEEKREEAGLIKAPMDNDSTNIVDTAKIIEEEQQDKE